MGFYPPNSSKQVLSAGEIKSIYSGKGMPTIKIRKAKQINDRLGVHAIIDGFTLIPIFNYKEFSFNNDVIFDGC